MNIKGTYREYFGINFNPEFVIAGFFCNCERSGRGLRIVSESDIADAGATMEKEMGFETAEIYQSRTGAALALRRATTASPPPKAVVVICHGLSEHADRYAEFADLLVSHDLSVYAHDHRGHGATKAPGAALGRFAPTDGVRLVIEDVMAIRNLAAAENPGLPIILFGHSMGGMMAVATAEAHPAAFDAIAIWNADLDPGLAGVAGRWLLLLERLLKGSDVPSSFGPRFTFQQWAKAVSDGRTDFDWLSTDPAEVDAYAGDPLCGWAPSVSMWLDVLQLAAGAGSKEALNRLSRTMPVNIVGGGQDPATRNGTAMEWLAKRMKAMGFLNVHLTIYHQMRHETLNEFDRLQAMKAFAAWAQDVAAEVSGTP
jgi:alpha-beta hydrolase superfamily lysophospholipase